MAFGKCVVCSEDVSISELKSGMCERCFPNDLIKEAHGEGFKEGKAFFTNKLVRLLQPYFDPTSVDVEENCIFITIDRILKEWNQLKKK